MAATGGWVCPPLTGGGGGGGCEPSLFLSQSTTPTAMTIAATMAIFAAVNWSRMGKKHGISDDDAYENLGRGVSVNIGGDGSALLPPKEIRIVTYDHDPAEDEQGADGKPSGEEAAE